MGLPIAYQRQCKQCGRKSIFLTLHEDGLCSSCHQKTEFLKQTEKFNKSYPFASTSRTSTVMSCPHCTPYIILDTETTGFNPSMDKIIQLSAIKYTPDGTPVDFYNTYLNPGCPIPADATRVNGITNEMVSNAPKAEDIRDDFLSFLEEKLIVGYNVNFDLRFLYYTFGDIFDEWGYVDALMMAREFLPMPDYKLTTVASCIGFEPSGSFHDSFTDCEAVATVLRYIGEDLDYWNKAFHISNDGSSPSGSYMGIRFPSHGKVRPGDIHRTVDASAIDPDNPFFGKTVVFTGELTISRAEAMQAVVDLGAVVRGSVSKKTDYLVVGEQDLRLVGDDGKSSKEEKAAALNESGAAHIEILYEKQFLSIIQREAYDGRF